jgi:hypothetical protein
VDFEQTVRDMDAEIRVHSDQISVNRRVMQLSQRQALRTLPAGQIARSHLSGRRLGPSKRWVVVVCQPMTNKVGMSILRIS